MRILLSISFNPFALFPDPRVTPVAYIQTQPKDHPYLCTALGHCRLLPLEVMPPQQKIGS